MCLKAADVLNSSPAAPLPEPFSQIWAGWPFAPLFAGKVGAPDGQRFEHGALERAPVEVE